MKPESVRKGIRIDSVPLCQCRFFQWARGTLMKKRIHVPVIAWFDWPEKIKKKLVAQSTSETGPWSSRKWASSRFYFISTYRNAQVLPYLLMKVSRVLWRSVIFYHTTFPFVIQRKLRNLYGKLIWKIGWRGT